MTQGSKRLTWASYITFPTIKKIQKCSTRNFVCDVSMICLDKSSLFVKSTLSRLLQETLYKSTQTHEITSLEKAPNGQHTLCSLRRRKLIIFKKKGRKTCLYDPKGYCRHFFLIWKRLFLAEHRSSSSKTPLQPCFFHRKSWFSLAKLGFPCQNFPTVNPSSRRAYSRVVTDVACDDFVGL